MKLSCAQLLCSLAALTRFTAHGAQVIPEGKTHTIQVGSSDMISTLMDDGTESLGDVFTWDRSNKIYKTDDPTAIASGADVLGDNQGHCVRLTNAGDDSEWDCTFTIFLSDGQIHAHGPFNAGTTTCTITGGSGKYLGATGTMDLFFAETHDATTAAVDANGTIFSYHYVFNLSGTSSSSSGGAEDDNGDEGMGDSGSRRLGQCGATTVASALQMGLIGSIPFW